jgi:hypothetical protein
LSTRFLSQKPNHWKQDLEITADFKVIKLTNGTQRQFVLRLSLSLAADPRFRMADNNVGTRSLKSNFTYGLSHEQETTLGGWKRH